MKRQHGFGLIEVLIAFIVVAVTAGSLLQLNKNYLEYSRDGRNREVALRLAESRLDELRGFKDKAAYEAIEGGSGTTTTLDDVEYEIEVAVTDYGWDSANKKWVKDGTPSGKKEVTVTVDWSDAGTPQSFTLASVVIPEQSFSEGPFGSGGGYAGLGLGGPDVDHTANDVLLIDLGKGYTQETSVPIRKDNKVSFNTTTYKREKEEDKTDEDGKKRQVQEFETVECNCRLASEVEAKLPGQREMLGDFSYWKAGGTAIKQTGTNNSSKSASLCIRCCQNHFDYDPVDSSKDEFSNWYDVIKWKSNDGPHKHYGSLLGVLKDLPATTLLPDYLDSCRFVRIDGVFEVVNDWNLVVLNIIKKDFMSDSERLVDYEDYVEQVVIEHLRKQMLDGEQYSVSSYTEPSITLEQYLADKYPSSDEWKDKFYFKHDEKKEVVARGIYIDMLSEDYRLDLVNKMPEDTSVDNLISEGFIRYAPFTEVILNELMKWDLKDKNATDKVKFYDRDTWKIETDYIKDENAVTPVEATVGSMRRSNSGITGNPISPDESGDKKQGVIYIDLTR